MTDVKMSVTTTEENRAWLEELAKLYKITRTQLLGHVVDSYLEWEAQKGSFAILLKEKLKK